MDELAHMLSIMAPGQIEQAVQLLQQYRTMSRGGNNCNERENKQLLTCNDNNNNNNNDVSNNAGGGKNCSSSPAGVESNVFKSTPDVCNAVSSVIALALRQTLRESVSTPGVVDESLSNKNDDDIPLAIILRRRLREGEKEKNLEVSAQRKKVRETAASEKGESGDNEQLADENIALSPGRNVSFLKATKQQEQQQATATTVRGLASFGFVSSAKRPVVTASEKNKLFTPFVQDRRVVPSALRFWSHENVSKRQSPPPPPPSLLAQQGQSAFFLPQDQHSVTERDLFAVDDNSSSLMHSLVTCCNETSEVARCGQKPSRYASFGDMIEAVSVDVIGQRSSQTNNDSDNNALIQGQKELLCPCMFHVDITIPRVAFKNEVVFCAFYAVGYDPCQSRPPYFGTYNNQDTFNTEELLRLARFGVGEEMPQMSNIDYEYDSADDWDVVEGDEDLAASSSESEDEEDSSTVLLSESDIDFINDDIEDDDDSDVDLQRRMVEERQRRMNRLRQKDKLVPAFSGPFVGIAIVEHPLREYDQLQRVGSALDPATFTALMERELHSVTASAATCGTAGVGDDFFSGDVTSDGLDEKIMQQRLVAAALRNRREMLPEELDAVHAIIAANGKISPKAIVETLLGQQLCAGVARAEIIRTIRRHYDRRHNTMVRRDEPWSRTDERLFIKQHMRQRPNGNKDNKGGTGLGRSYCEEEVRREDDSEDDEEITLAKLALKRLRVGNEGVEGRC